MSACGSGYGSLDGPFARRVELALVHEELQELLEVAPSQEVFRAEHAADVTATGRDVPLRVTLTRLVRDAAPGRRPRGPAGS